MDAERDMTRKMQDDDDEGRAQIFLQPIASPSILGLFGLAAALFVWSTRWAHWYGDDSTMMYLFPFLAFVGGLTQFLAGMWCYKARDGVGTALHGLWGAFWIGFAFLYFLGALGVLAIPAGSFVAFGYYLIAMAAITWTIAIAAFAENGVLGTVTLILALGTTVLAVGQCFGYTPLVKTGGWLLWVTSLLAWYAASAVMIDEAYGRRLLPTLELGGVGRGARERRAAGTVDYGEPGVAHAH